MLISIFVYTLVHTQTRYDFNIRSGAAINFDSGANVMLVGSGWPLSFVALFEYQKYACAPEY